MVLEEKGLLAVIVGVISIGGFLFGYDTVSALLTHPPPPSLSLLGTASPPPTAAHATVHATAHAHSPRSSFLLPIGPSPHRAW